MTHADDSTLVALLDGELSGESEWREHLEGCPTCRARLAELERLSLELGRGLAALPVGEPAYDPRFLELLERSSAGTPAPAPVAVRRRPRFTVDRRVLAAAAVLALLLLVPQARAWLFEGIGSVLGIARPEAAAPPATPAAPAEEVPPTEVSASFAREVLVIDIRGDESPERLVLRRVGGSRAALRVLPADARTEMLVSGDGFHVTAPGPRSVLELDLPDAVRTVEVRRAGRTLIRRDVTDLGDASLVLPLAGASNTGDGGGER